MRRRKDFLMEVQNKDGEGYWLAADLSDAEHKQTWRHSLQGWGYFMTMESFDLLPSIQRDRKRIWYTGGTLPTPHSRGVRSMSSGATGLAKEKFWRMVVKKRNNSARAMPSPRQMRFPVGTEDHQGGPRVDAHSLPKAQSPVSIATGLHG